MRESVFLPPLNSELMEKEIVNSVGGNSLFAGKSGRMELTHEAKMSFLLPFFYIELSG